jgi:rod shape-determining protein MreD
MAVYYIGIPLLFLAAVFDTTILTLFRVWGGGPNLMLIVVVSWAMLVDIRQALPWAMIGGIFRDLLSIAPTGASALVFVLIVIAIDTYLPKLDWRNIVIPPLVVGAATVVYDGTVLGILILTGRPIPEFATLYYSILPGVIENMVLVLVVFRLMGATNAFLRPSRPGIQ